MSNTHADYEMECGHVQTVLFLADLRARMVCAICQGNRKLIAVECREYRFKCQAMGRTRKCGYTVWCGQNQAEAFRASNAHAEATGHSSSDIAYIWVDGKKRMIQHLFGKKFRTIIIPKERQRKHPLNPQPIPPVIPFPETEQKEIPF